MGSGTPSGNFTAGLSIRAWFLLKIGCVSRIAESFSEDEEILYLTSGDPLIYGLGKWLSEKFKGRVVISPGISAMQYLASRIALPMNDAYLTSSHAKEPNFDLIMSLSKVFMVTDQKVGLYEIAPRGC